MICQNLSKGSRTFFTYPEIIFEHHSSRQVRAARDPARMSHRCVRPLLGGGIIGKEQISLPKAEGAMRLERGEAAKQSLVAEGRHPPFQCLFHARTGSMDQLPKMFQDWPGKWR